MRIWGKVLGAFFGFLLGNIIGALIGLWIGHRFDRGMGLRGRFVAARVKSSKPSSSMLPSR